MIDIKFRKEGNKAIAYDGDIEIGVCEYIETDDSWNIIHTLVDNKYQGQGIARRLVDSIIKNADKNNKKLVADCSYAKKILDRDMQLLEIKDRSEILVENLLKVWEKSVKTTHLFLSDSEIQEIKKYVPQAIKDIQHLIVMIDNNKEPIAFMGIENKKLEMLFITPEERGKGFGKKLINYGKEKYNINELTVNEQNPEAKGFYEHMGFEVYKREEVDEQGQPYPILYMKLK